jgi:hypothetical protein
MREALTDIRAEAWKIADFTANPFKADATRSSVAYHRPPILHHDGPDALVKEMSQQLMSACLWPLKQRYQRDTRGMREMLMRADVIQRGSDWHPTYRTVFPDWVSLEANPEEPDRPVILREAVERKDKLDPGGIWTWDVWDMKDPLNPRMYVTNERADPESEQEMTQRFLKQPDGSPAPAGGLTGDLWTWRWADREPFLPFVLDHAEITGCLWDPWDGIELVNGTLIVALLWSFYNHAVRNASWAQRYTIGMEIPTDAVGGAIESGRGTLALRQDGTRSRVRVIADPSTIAMFQVAPNFDGTPEAGSFDIPCSPKELAEAIAIYERRLLAYAGQAPTNAQRIAGDPRSGFAMALNRDDVREEQRRHAPVLAVGDAELIAKTGALLNRATNTGRLPESGWRPEYQQLPLSAMEQKARQDAAEQLINLGLLDKVTAYQQLHPGTTQADAIRQLRDIQAINAQF